MPAVRTRDTQSRSLEVMTDAPQPPTLAIISPTPRAFTFPSTHNLADSPYSSPSHSPFEPDQLDLISLPSQCTLVSHLTTNPHQLQRTPSPISPVTELSTSPSPSQTLTHQRRKSSTCSLSGDEERRPRKGDSDYIKRPENAFILFRRKCCEERQAAANEDNLDGPTKKQRQADLSKTISQQWKSLSPEERKVWEDKAKERKKEHEAMYPNYVYRPQRSKDKARGKKVGKAGPKGDEAGPENVAFVLPMPSQRHGRSASAPTPPPYQSILLPNVYQMTPSCPTSPSLLPMITRHASQTGQPEDCVNNFDFLPHDNFMPPPSFGQTNFEASLQSSEFLRNIFAMPNLTSGHQKSNLSLDLLPPASISPASSVGSSGPSSPVSSPYTPLAATANQSFTQQLAGIDIPIPEPRQGELEVPTDMHISQHISQDLSSYSWDTNSIWPSGSEILLGDDFDLNAIPAIELGNNKFTEQYVEPTSTLQFGQDFTHALEGREYSQDTMINFDEMMASGPRY